MLSATNTHLEALRKENLELKTELQRRKTEALNPFKIPAIQSAFKEQIVKVQAIENIREGIIELLGSQASEFETQILATRHALNKVKVDFTAKVSSFVC